MPGRQLGLPGRRFSGAVVSAVESACCAINQCYANLLATYKHQLQINLFDLQQRQAAEVRIRAERRAGELLKEMKETGQRHNGHDTSAASEKRGLNVSRGTRPTSPTLADLGISKDKSSTWQKLASVPHDEFEEALAADEDTGCASSIDGHTAILYAGRIMKILAVKTTAALVCLAVSLSGETFKDVGYFYKPEGKDKGEQIEGSLAYQGDSKKVSFQSKKKSLDVPYSSITSALYERASKPRYAAGLLFAWPLLFTKSKQHYLTIQYQEGGQGRYAVFHLDKGNYREVVAATEAAIGKKVERSEEK